MPRRRVHVLQRLVVVAVAIVSGLGATVAPMSVAVSVKGVNCASEVRRASTVTSQTPGVGLVTVRLSGLPTHDPADGE